NRVQTTIAKEIPMWFRSLANSLKPRSSRRPARRMPQRPVTCRLQIEALEDRSLPSVYALTDLGTLGGSASAAAAINDVGQIAGSAQTADQVYHAFLWANGTMTDLGTLGGSSSRATAINNLGQVVGYTYDAAGQSHAVLWTSGGVTDLGTFGGVSS